MIYASATEQAPNCARDLNGSRITIAFSDENISSKKSAKPRTLQTICN
jgi:hypothetical protein